MLWGREEKGILAIEILIVIFIVSVGLVGLLGATVFSLKFTAANKETIQANFLAQELLEATRNFRDGTDWNVNGLGTLDLDAPYHPQKIGSNPPSWSLVLGEESVEGFSRKIIFQSVLRDINDNIITIQSPPKSPMYFDEGEEGEPEDFNTKKIIAMVSWKNKKVEIITYLTNWKQ